MWGCEWECKWPWPRLQTNGHKIHFWKNNFNRQPINDKIGKLHFLILFFRSPLSNHQFPLSISLRLIFRSIKLNGTKQYLHHIFNRIIKSNVTISSHVAPEGAKEKRKSAIHKLIHKIFPKKKKKKTVIFFFQLDGVCARVSTTFSSSFYDTAFFGANHKIYRQEMKNGIKKYHCGKKDTRIILHPPQNTIGRANNDEDDDDDDDDD